MLSGRLKSLLKSYFFKTDENQTPAESDSVKKITDKAHDVSKAKQKIKINKQILVFDFIADNLKKQLQFDILEQEEDKKINRETAHFKPETEEFRQETTEFNFETTEPLLLLGQAGRGKTRLLADFVLNLMQKGVAPNDILVLSLSRRAAVDFDQNLLLKLQSENLPLPQVDTLYILAFTLWNKVLDTPVLLSYEKAKQVFINANPNVELNILEKTWAEINLYRENNQPCPEYLEKYYQPYIREKDSWNLVDYPELLEFWLEQIDNGMFIPKWQYLLVDEFQDFSPLQYNLILKLSPQTGQGFIAAADFNQTIFNFNNDNLALLKCLRDKWTNLKIVYLSINYRSLFNFDLFSNILTDKNKFLPPANLLSYQTEKTTQKCKLFLFTAPDADKEALWIGKQIFNLLDFNHFIFEKNIQLHPKLNIDLGGRFKDEKKLAEIKNNKLKTLTKNALVAFFSSQVPEGKEYKLKNTSRLAPKDITILLRCRELMQPLKKSLQSLGIPCSVPEEDAFWLDFRVKLILDAVGIFLGVSTEQNQEQRLICPDQVLAKGPLGVAGFVQNYGIFDNDFWDSPTFKSLIKAFDYNQGWAGLINWINLQNELELTGKDNRKIQIVSYQSIKGLEFEVIFAPCLEEGLMPYIGNDLLKQHLLNHAEINLEKEATLFYLGLTKAKQAIFLSHSKQRTLQNKELHLALSSFIKKIPPNLLHYKKIKPKNIEKKQLNIFQ